MEALTGIGTDYYQNETVTVEIAAPYRYVYPEHPDSLLQKNSC